MLKASTQEMSSMRLTELLSMREKMDEAIKEVKARERVELQAKFKKQANAAGFFDLAEVLHVKSAKGKHTNGSAKPAKYANPEDKSQTWTGQGRKPNWLVAKLGKGAALADFTI